MSEIFLSEKEQNLYDYIKNASLLHPAINVTIKLIETEMGKEFVGALGKLLHLKIIKSEKRNLETGTGNEILNQYGKKWTKCYFVGKEE